MPLGSVQAKPIGVRVKSSSFTHCDNACVSRMYGARRRKCTPITCRAGAQRVADTIWIQLEKTTHRFGFSLISLRKALPGQVGMNGPRAGCEHCRVPNSRVRIIKRIDLRSAEYRRVWRRLAWNNPRDVAASERFDMVDIRQIANRFLDGSASAGLWVGRQDMTLSATDKKQAMSTLRYAIVGSV